MKKLVIGSILVLACGAFYISEPDSNDDRCEIVNNFDDATRIGLKYFEDNPQLWSAYYSDLEDMKRSATSGHMGSAEREDEITLTGIKRKWTYMLNLQCTKGAHSQYCKSAFVTFKQCRQ